MSRRVSNTLLLVLAIGLGSYATWHWQRSRVPPPEPEQRSDYVLRDFELTALDEEGTEAFTLVSPHLQRDPSGRHLDIRRPRFAFPSDSGTWQARSDSAWVAPKAEEVRLQGGVSMVGPVEASGNRTRINTGVLSVFPDAQRASTDDRVTITQGDSSYAGTGLRVDMVAKRIQLLNDVKGHYAPRQ